MNSKIKKITVITATAIIGFTINACSIDTGNQIKAANMENNTTNKGGNIDNDDSDELSDEDQIGMVVHDFFTFSVKPFNSLDDNPNINNPVTSMEIAYSATIKNDSLIYNDDNILVDLEQIMDLTPYINYNDLNTNVKEVLNASINESKITSEYSGVEPNYLVDHSKISINGDNATISGDGISFTIPGLGTETLSPETKLKIIKTDDGWRLDGNKLSEIMSKW